MNTKPTASLRTTPEREKNIAIALRTVGGDVARAVVQAMETCINCEYFDEPTEVCALAQARPPARVIAHGCPSYSAKVPF